MRRENNRPPDWLRSLLESLDVLEADALQQVHALLRLAAENIAPGADLRKQAFAIAQHPAVRLWLELSEALVESEPGPARLRKLRVRGELRYLYDDQRGFPILRPRYAAVREGDSVTKLFALRDEMSWFPIIGVMDPKCGWRPRRNQLETTHVRAIIFMRVRALERNMHERLVPGRIPGARHEPVLFDTESFMCARWTQRRLRAF